MNKVYCIEDIHKKNYVGITIQTLEARLNNHKQDKKNNYNISSTELDLDNCKIYILEDNISDENKKEREKYWINTIDCVNKIKFVGRKENLRKYNNSEKNKLNQQRYREKHRQEINQKNRDFRKNNLERRREISRNSAQRIYNYRKLWGDYNHCLLDINMDLFQ